MTSTHATSLPRVNLATVRQKVSKTKSESTARYYTAMLNRLEQYNNSPELDLNAVDSKFVTDFGGFLLREGITPSSAKLFKMAFRAVMKDAFGTENRNRFKAAFSALDSKNDAPTNRITPDDLRAIRRCNLTPYPVLDKIRSVFIQCTLSGGITLKNLQEDHEWPSEPIHLAQLQDEFQKKFQSPMARFAAALTDEQYARALQQIAHEAHLTHTLTPQSALDGWVAAAIQAGVPTPIIAAMVPEASPYHALAPAPATLNEFMRHKALATAADAIIETRTRWYAMRCTDCEPEAVKQLLCQRAIIDSDTPFAIYVAPTARDRRKQPGRSPLQDLCFFNCRPADAQKIRSGIHDAAYVYALRGAATPTPIPDWEMKTFMLLCDAAEDTLSCHFADTPTNEHLTPGRPARITNGNLTGYVGIITALPDNKYTVQLTLTTLSATLTATVPVAFIQEL